MASHSASKRKSNSEQLIWPRDGNFLWLRAVLDKLTFAKLEHYLYVSLVYRTLNSIVVNTFFNPDEYWQSYEVAHHMAFGVGVKTWEWKEEWAIRTYLYPFVLSMIFRLLNGLGMTHYNNYIYVVKVFHGVITACIDYVSICIASHWFSLAEKKREKNTKALIQQRTKKNTIIAFVYLCIVSNWFYFYAMSRAFSNSVETLWTMLALSCHMSTNEVVLPWHLFFNWHWLFCVSLCVMIRPSSVLFWVVVVVMECVHSTKVWSHLKTLEWRVLRRVATAVCLAVAFLCAFDSYFYNAKKLIFTPYQFFKFNILMQGADLYGVHPWHWYVSNALPVLLLTMLPMLLFGVWMQCRYRHFAVMQKYVHIVGVYLFFLSLTSAHKEYRFLLPILPLLLIVCGYGLFVFATQLRNVSSSLRTCFVLTLFFVQWVAIVFFCRAHQRGAISVVEQLAQEMLSLHTRYNNSNNNNNDEYYGHDWSHIRVDHVVSCHSTPFFAFLHLPVDTATRYPNMNYFDCSPHFLQFLTRHYTQTWFLENKTKQFLIFYYLLGGDGCPSSSAYLNHSAGGIFNNDYAIKARVCPSCPHYVIVENIHLDSLLEVMNIRNCVYDVIGKHINNWFDGQHYLLLKYKRPLNATF
ncbi:plasmid maintenance protein [Reticulomyxa filosa]|uniref:Mannosyltransferase n=1 Tax=Reticulomyxa filosa TaxID=46433 RepID=X6NLA2_RETFI|nr:plasmid maintenance protein [Reticulomyxa filosa]|eukprot:ETO27065.1 plasmid maintenance protein [Reticulomyxa filosa]